MVVRPAVTVVAGGLLTAIYLTCRFLVAMVLSRAMVVLCPMWWLIRWM